MEGWTLSESQVVASTDWLRIEKNRYLRGGRIVDDYYVLRRSGFVVVVAVDSEDDVLLVREYRPATGKSYLAFPAGYIDPGEHPEQAAIRELREETGARGSNWRALGRLDPLPGYIDSPAHIFRCDVVRHDAEAYVREDATEDGLEIVRLSRASVRDAIACGEMTEMQAVSAFLLADEIERRSAHSDTE
jgi:8-oxo-dGTP pyrophosphatase MutT (NUDIX family)